MSRCGQGRYNQRMTQTSQLVRYAVARKNGMYPMGTPFHTQCLMEYDKHAYEKNFSEGEIDPAELEGKRCGYCHDDWRPDPKRMEAIEAAPHSGCLNCGGHTQTLEMDEVIAVGFGMAEVTCDGVCVLDGEAISRGELNPDPDGDEDFVGGREVLVQEAEDLAAADPDHDWRIRFEGPMGGRVYQRHGDAQWVYVKRLPGFA